MKKRKIFSIAILIGFILFMDFCSYAYDFESNGIYYNINSINDTYEVEVTCGENYYSYKGDITLPEYVIYNEIEYFVTSIGSYAFYGCENLENIYLPASLTKIGTSAFSSCIALTDIVIPESVTEIEDSAFEGCINLTNIEILDPISEISE